MMRAPITGRIGRWIVVLTCGAVLAASCGDADGDSGGDGDASTGATQTAPDADTSGEGSGGADRADAPADVVADAIAATSANKRGTFRSPPSSGPPVREGAHVMIISCGELLPSCSEPVAEVKSVGESLGWTMDVRDANFVPSDAGAFIEEAVAARYDGIILDAIDCAPVKAALEQARDAAIPVVSFYAYDCDDPYSNAGEALFTQPNYSDDYESYGPFTEAWGRAKADWLIAETGGEVKIIELRQDDFIVVSYINDGFEKRIAECDGCEIVDTVQFVGPDIATGEFAQKVATALQANPEAQAIHFPYDGLFLLGGATALTDAGRVGDILAVGGETTSVNFDLLRTGVQSMANVFVHRWTARAAIDTLNRALQGETEIPDSGLGWVILDADNVPDTGMYEPEIDYVAAYRKLWGLD